MGLPGVRGPPGIPGDAGPSGGTDFLPINYKTNSITSQ